MRIRKLQGFDTFTCLAAECPNTCCQAWNIELDRETAEKYRTLQGDLGEKLRGLTARDRAGRDWLRLKRGRRRNCPLHGPDGLCGIQKELGEDWLCESCRLHPRVGEEYGMTREWCLSLSCPEAARQLLSDETPLSYTEELTDEPVNGVNDLDGELFYTLQNARKCLFALAQDRGRPLMERIEGLLAFGERLQRALDRGRPDPCREAMGVVFRRPRPSLQAGDPLGPLLELECLDPAWRERVRDAVLCAPTAEQRAAAPIPDREGEHLLYYFLYRWFFKAVLDRDALFRVRYAVFSVLCIRELEAAHFVRTGALSLDDRVDIVHRYCREVEHSSRNMAALARKFTVSSTFPPEISL